MNIKLVKPNDGLKKALAFKEEFFAHAENIINGSGGLDTIKDYDAWIQAVTNNASAAMVNPAWVVTDTFFALDESDKIVGIIDLMHTLKDVLLNLGNCGYSVRPSERKNAMPPKCFILS